jgi:hypothetical protein
VIFGSAGGLASGLAPELASCACAANVNRIPGSSGEAIPAQLHAFKKALRLRVMRKIPFQAEEALAENYS